MTTYYDMSEVATEIYSLLQDQLSKEVFWTRLQYDIAKDMDSLMKFSEYYTGKNEEATSWRKTFRKIHDDGKKIVLFGAGVAGEAIGKAILYSGEGFDAYCDSDCNNLKEGLLGRTVISPEELLQNKDDYYVLISVLMAENLGGIRSFLLDNDFPEERILPFFSAFNVNVADVERQYFEFPELYSSGTAFIDAGCYRCETSLEFAAWCKDEYSEIFAFEPDRRNYEICKDTIEKHRDLRIKLYQCGLSEKTGKSEFMSCGNAGSYFINAEREDNKPIRIVDGGIEEIALAAIDDAVGDTVVGFIKMDIEGFEYSALKGAEKTIQRDKPLCAICVYHRPGDVLAIMDYLHKLVPEYRFWLRHYSHTYCETVLYAAI